MHPDLPTGNTQAIVMVAAEAAAARILAFGSEFSNGTVPGASSAVPEAAHQTSTTISPALSIITGSAVNPTATPIESASPIVTTSASATDSSSATPVEFSSASTPIPTPSSTPKPDNSVAQLYYQCGGQGWTGTSRCADGLTCTKQNDFYSQCL